MKLVHPDFPCQIAWKENQITTLVLESPRLYMETLSQWMRQSQGEDERWVLSNAGEILPLSKKGEIIINVFDLDMNQRKLITQLYELTTREVQNSELLLNWRELEQSMIQAMDQMVESIDYGTTYHVEVELKEFLKFMNLKFTDDTENLIDKIMDYVLLVHKILKIEVFIFVNLKMYFDTETLNLLMQRFLYEKISILLLEGRVCEEKLDQENVIIVDKDACVIYN